MTRGYVSGTLISGPQMGSLIRMLVSGPSRGVSFLDTGTLQATDHLLGGLLLPDRSSQERWSQLLGNCIYRCCCKQTIVVMIPLPPYEQHVCLLNFQKGLWQTFGLFEPAKNNYANRVNQHKKIM